MRAAGPGGTATFAFDFARARRDEAGTLSDTNLMVPCC
jgi:hypothetical protein